MTPDEVIDLLSLIAAFDQRTTGESDVEAWLAVANAEQWTWPLAYRAMINYHRSGGDKPRITPARITDAILDVRATIRRTVLRTDLTPPRELADDPRAEIEWRREYVRQATDAALAAWAEDAPLPEAPVLEAPVRTTIPPELVEFAERFAPQLDRVREPADANERRRLVERARAELDGRRNAEGAIVGMGPVSVPGDAESGAPAARGGPA